MADCPYGVRSGHLRIHYRNSDNSEDMVEMQLEAKAIVVFWLYNSKVFSFPNPITVTRIELKVKDTPIDYSYDVNYAVSGECLTLTAKKYFNEYLTPDDHISASSSIAYDLEAVDIDGEGRIYQNGTNYQYDYYLKDHLGSTRMVINDQNQITEAIAYQPYGTIIPLDDIASSPQTPTRQQFTGKEFDREGSGVGISGMELYYFGKRYYDPEIGYWIAVDPKGQFFNGYAYAGGGTNPIIFVDPNGEWLGAVIGGFVGAYLGGAIYNGSLNPKDWSDPISIFECAINGAIFGNSIEKAIAQAPRTTTYSVAETQEFVSSGENLTKLDSKDATPFQKASNQAYKKGLEERQSSRWNKLLGYDKNEWAMGAQYINENGKLVTSWKMGGRDYVNLPPEWATNSKYIIHNHYVHAYPSVSATGQSDILSARTFNSGNRYKMGTPYKGDWGFYHQPTNTFYGYSSVFGEGLMSYTNSFWLMTNAF